jgi:predicted lipoprotein with Yx(FWY)xxD motif
MQNVNRQPFRASHGRGRAAAVIVVMGMVSVTSLSGIAGGSTNHSAKHLTVATAQNAQFGTFLVSGKTVYTLKASKVRCGAQCLKIWPELLLPKGVKHATASPGVNAAKLGSVKRRGGTRQVTYRGKALYWFAGDTGSGQVNGFLKDKWGSWSVVVTAKPASASITTAPTAPVPTTPPATSTPTTSAGSRTGTTTPKSPQPTTPPPAPPTTTTTTPGSGGVGF